MIEGTDMMISSQWLQKQQLCSLRCMAICCYAYHTSAQLTGQKPNHSASTGFDEVCVDAAEETCFTGLPLCTDKPS